jgi:hypothetical protein
MPLPVIRAAGKRLEVVSPAADRMTGPREQHQDRADHDDDDDADRPDNSDFGDKADDEENDARE